MRAKRVGFWIAIGCAAYAMVVFLAYRATPLGQVALLDAREQQALAQQIAEGTLPAKPFYRAPLYAGVLSIFYQLGADEPLVLLAGQLLNLMLHLLAAWALGRAASQVWGSRAAGWFAAGLYGLYPVSLYLALDLLDTSLAQALLCTALWFTARLVYGQKLKYAVALGLVLALLGLARPQMLTIALGMLTLLILGAQPGTRSRPVWVSLGVFALTLILFGLGEWRRTGSFYLLPSQGTYNLWSANRPGATGEYYAQQIELPYLPEGHNPARVEALVLYQQATGRLGQVSEATVNKYWQEKLWSHIKENPGQAAALYTKKLYALWHQHEAYNNKTYALQKELLWPLRWNFLSFVLLSTAALAVLLYAPAVPWDRLGPFLWVLSLYWLAAALFYTSDRFRLPMVPFVLLVAAGLPLCLRRVLQLKIKKDGWKLVSLGAWATVFSLPLAGVGSTRTHQADYRLMSQAALKLGQDEEAERFSLKAANEDLDAPLSPTEIENLLQARYNTLLKKYQRPSSQWCQQQLELAAQLPEPSAEASLVQGLCRWHLHGERYTWHQMAAQAQGRARAHALAALMMTGPLWAEEVAELQDMEEQEVILVAHAALGHPQAQAKLTALSGATQARSTWEAWRNLFDRQP